MTDRLKAPGVVRVDSWSEWPWLKAGFSTRQGGESEAYGPGEQNLSWTKEDPAEVVARNRERFVQAVAGKSAMELVTIQQVHGDVIQTIENGHAALSTAEGRGVLRGDGLMTALPGLLLGIQTADCVPVLVVDVKQRVVAAFHAGWRGTVARIAEQGVGAMRMKYGSKEEDLVAAVGPSIGACCFAVGEEVKQRFQSQFAYAAKLFSEVDEAGPKIRMDLWEANRRQLVDAGVAAERITVVGECSACTRVRGGARTYFSHRAESGYTGRMLSVVGVVQGIECRG